jgi:hypothetical protein
MHTCKDQHSYGSQHARGRPGGAGLLGTLAVVAAMSVVLAAVGSVHAAVFQCPAGDVACLIAAINTANGNGEEDTITLAAGTYTLTAVDNDTDEPNGLPSINSTVTIQGTGPETTVIERDASAPRFRILHVAAAGSLTLEGLTIRGGESLEVGGGLFNSGTVLLTNCTIVGNAAGALAMPAAAFLPAAARSSSPTAPSPTTSRGRRAAAASKTPAQAR